MKAARRGCGCVLLLVVLIASIPLMAVSCGGAPPDAGAAAAGTAAVPMPHGWTPLFSWTPAGGGADAATWPWGQCTWFVVSEGHLGGDHRVTWSGDAWQWYGAAAAAGLSTVPPTSTPQPGWIAVFARGHGSDASAGHVAVVVAVAATTYTVAEANVLGLGLIDQRTLLLPDTSADAAQLQPLLEGWIP